MSNSTKVNGAKYFQDSGSESSSENLIHKSQTPATTGNNMNEFQWTQYQDEDTKPSLLVKLKNFGKNLVDTDDADSKNNMKSVLTKSELSTDNFDAIIKLIEKEKALKIKSREEIKRLEDIGVKWSAEKKDLKDWVQSLSDRLRQKEAALEDTKRRIAIAEERCLEETQRVEAGKSTIKSLRSQLMDKDAMYIKARKITEDMEQRLNWLEGKVEESTSIIEDLKKTLVIVEEDTRHCKEQCRDKDMKVKHFVENVYAALAPSSSVAKSKLPKDFSFRDLEVAEVNLMAVIKDKMRKCEKVFQKCQELERQRVASEPKTRDDDATIVCYRK